MRLEEFAQVAFSKSKNATCVERKSCTNPTLRNPKTKKTHKKCVAHGYILLPLFLLTQNVSCSENNQGLGCFWRFLAFLTPSGGKFCNATAIIFNDVYHFRGLSEIIVLYSSPWKTPFEIRIILYYKIQLENVVKNLSHIVPVSPIWNTANRITIRTKIDFI